jgi:hypothetical protein
VLQQEAAVVAVDVQPKIMAAEAVVLAVEDLSLEK